MTPARRCRGCYQSMAIPSGCSVSRVVVMGRTSERIRHSGLVGGPCPECGTIANGYHHLGCPIDECPVCGRRGKSCGCGRLMVPSGPPMRADGQLQAEPWEAELGNAADNVEAGG